MNRHLAVVFFLCLLALPGLLRAQDWSTGYFNSDNGYPREGSLTDTPTNAPASEQFQTTDPWNGVTGDTSYLDYVSGWTFGVGGSSAGNSSVYFGGFALGTYDPGVTNPSYYRTFASSIATNTDSVTFSIDFGIIPGAGPQDVFGFDMRAADTATDLVKFWFDPALATSQDLRLQYSTGPGGGTGGSFEIDYGSLYNFSATLSGASFSASIAGINVQTNLAGDVTGFVTNSATTVASGSMTNGTASDFESTFINWQLTSGDIGNPGENYMLINQMSVQTVPEPSTVAMLCLGAAALGWRGLRRHRK